MHAARTHACSTVAVPVYVRHSIVFSETGGKLDITLGPKQNMGKMVNSNNPIVVEYMCGAYS